MSRSDNQKDATSIFQQALETRDRVANHKARVEVFRAWRSAEFPKPEVIWYEHTNNLQSTATVDQPPITYADTTRESRLEDAKRAYYEKRDLR